MKGLEENGIGVALTREEESALETWKSARTMESGIVGDFWWARKGMDGKVTTVNEFLGFMAKLRRLDSVEPGISKVFERADSYAEFVREMFLVWVAKRESADAGEEECQRLRQRVATLTEKAENLEHETTMAEERIAAMERETRARLAQGRIQGKRVRRIKMSKN